MYKMNCPVDQQPKAGDVYYCDMCGMTVLVVRECKCSDARCVSLACCGEAMALVNCGDSK